MKKTKERIYCALKYCSFAGLGGIPVYLLTMKGNTSAAMFASLLFAFSAFWFTLKESKARVERMTQDIVEEALRGRK